MYESEEVSLGNNVWAQYINDGLILSVKVFRNSRTAAGIVLKEETLQNLDEFLKKIRKDLKKSKKSTTR